MKFLVQALNKLIYEAFAKQTDFLDMKDIVSIKFCNLRYKRKHEGDSYVEVRVDFYNKEGVLVKDDLWSTGDTARIYKAFENIFSRKFGYSTSQYTVYCDAQKNVDTIYRITQSKNGPNVSGTVNHYYLKTAL